jgi:hypothetical protein
MAEVPVSPSNAAAARLAPSPVALAARLKSGSGWFLWIGVLSIINSLVYWFGGKMAFIVGLGITQVIDVLASNAGGAARGVALVLDIAVAGIFVLFWRFARTGMVGAFVVGMALYAVDGFIFLVVGDFVSFGFHLFALYWLFQGLQAAKQLQATAHLAGPPVVTPKPIG